MHNVILQAGIDRTQHLLLQVLEVPGSGTSPALKALLFSTSGSKVQMLAKTEPRASWWGAQLLSHHRSAAPHKQ